MKYSRRRDNHGAAPRIPRAVQLFCAQQGLSEALRTALTAICETFPTPITLQFFTETEGRPEVVLGIRVIADGDREEISRGYWACLDRWAELLKPEELSRFVLDRATP